jgi:hypothetical protein
MNAKVFTLGKALDHGLYQNWAHALAPPHMSPYFGKAHGVRHLTYTEQILFDLVKLSIDFKPYIRKAIIVGYDLVTRV